jgi:ribosomal protein L11 methyltransferase
MSWQTLSIRAEANYAEYLSEALLERGALSVDMLDADADTPDEQAIFGEPNEPTAAVWQHNLVNALFPQDADVEEIFQACCHELCIAPTPTHSVAILEDDDWVRLTQSQFDPIRISERLWIVPTWHTPTDPNAINIVLDPGLAFGTGSHPTTRLCLRWLDSHIRGGETVLDYGCGSGILAIAALKLGAGKTIGVDVDAQAVQASFDNAAANQVDAQFFLPDTAPDLHSDVVVANILTNPLRALAPLLANATNPGGRIVLSGILAEQADEVEQIYSAWFDFAPAQIEDGWVCLSGEKKNSLTSAQCPECHTRFKVTAEQLLAHQGKVRCGVCRAVFNAQAQLATDDLPLANDTANPHLALDTKLAAPVNSDKAPAARWPWLVGIALTIILFIGQLSYFYRVELSAQLPGLKPALVSYCQLLNCTVSLPQKIEKLAIESSEMSQDSQQSTVSRLNLLLHNSANFSQAYPAVELTLLDNEEKVIARRDFQAADYLKQKTDEKIGLAANRDASISLRLDTGELKSSGYKLFLFYPKH